MELPTHALFLNQLLIRAALTAVVAYFCGCFNGAVIVSKYILRDDVRKHGSGNAGLTNFYRSFGGPLTLLVILTDVVKAIVALLIGMVLLRSANEPTIAKYFSAVFCLLGHMFPCMFGFKGGKGILSGGTIAIMIDWRVALVVWGGFLFWAIATKWVSLGSIWAGVTLPIVTWFVYRDIWSLSLSVICGGLIIWMHRENLKRILKGEENKFSFHRKI